MNHTEAVAVMALVIPVMMEAIGWVYTSLSGRVSRLERDTESQGVCLGRLDERLKNIETLMKEVRADVRAIRNGGK